MIAPQFEDKKAHSPLKGRVFSLMHLLWARQVIQPLSGFSTSTWTLAKMSR
jgi:hypothetical protein